MIRSYGDFPSVEVDMKVFHCLHDCQQFSLGHTVVMLRFLQSSTVVCDDTLVRSGFVITRS